MGWAGATCRSAHAVCGTAAASLRSHLQHTCTHHLAAGPAAQGGEFIVKIKDATHAKLSVDKAVRDYDERVIHIESMDM